MSHFSARGLTSLSLCLAMAMGYTLRSTSPRSHAQHLIARKSAIEAALASQSAILRAQNADMSTPLVDPHGFPRADIDVVAVRTARVRILELRNDLNAILDDVKKALEDVHAANASVSKADVKADDTPLTPFARVDGVAPGSPAASAGLQREDLILAFGTLTLAGLSSSVPASSPSRLAPLAQLASSHEDRPLELKILRRSPESSSEPQTLTLTLIPRKWGGRGLIGCHIVPYTSPPP